MHLGNKLDGAIAGYDPGGNDCHGLAIAEFESDRCVALSTHTLQHTSAVIDRLQSIEELVAIGIDTLVCWGTGPSGWRAPDLWLRDKYKKVRSSVISPNGLYGSMALNGMAVLKALRDSSPSIHVTETHPKVLYWALSGRKYDYVNYSGQMNADLAQWLGTTVSTATDHEWDAAVSVLAAARGYSGAWEHDLFSDKSPDRETLVFPVGTVNYWWPE